MARPSSIDRLPEAVRDKLHDFLRDPAISQLEAVDLTNAILDEHGHDQRLSKSAVNRYAMRMEQVGAKLRESREVAKLWIGKLGSQPAGEVGKLLNEVLRTLAFEAAMPMIESGEPASAKVINQLALAVARLEKAAGDNEKHAAEIRRRAAEELAQQVEAEEERGPVTAERLREIMREAYGV